MKEVLTKNTGFTLIEIMVAVTIVGISFAVIVEGYISMSGLVQQMREYQLVSSFAKEKLNQLIHKVDLSSAGTEELGNLEVTWKSMNQDVGDGVRQVMIIVEWRGRKGPRSYQLTTLIEGGTYE
ncbi:hypothetical protein BBF96_03705 [Anoxybacter fermentans]|uniref:Prepilin-type N-terminal cleavage/methylation domain-containing protein n=1 Tax=Anoxybacter fermentans TaxID=1323375 RepID=A0A3S9SW61_9FIRM|nr:type II secretion system protein [Anoxybacter fermentans]AZR72567.1 hypothetical protein BBF96_03705 [Anoxybacter fermentans]